MKCISSSRSRLHAVLPPAYTHCGTASGLPSPHASTVSTRRQHPPVALVVRGSGRLPEAHSARHTLGGGSNSGDGAGAAAGAAGLAGGVGEEAGRAAGEEGGMGWRSQ